MGQAPGPWPIVPPLPAPGPPDPQPIAVDNADGAMSTARFTHPLEAPVRCSVRPPGFLLSISA